MKAKVSGVLFICGWLYSTLNNVAEIVEQDSLSNLYNGGPLDLL